MSVDRFLVVVEGEETPLVVARVGIDTSETSIGEAEDAAAGFVAENVELPGGAIVHVVLLDAVTSYITEEDDPTSLSRARLDLEGGSPDG